MQIDSGVCWAAISLKKTSSVDVTQKMNGLQNMVLLYEGGTAQLKYLWASENDEPTSFGGGSTLPSPLDLTVEADGSSLRASWFRKQDAQGAMSALGDSTSDQTTFMAWKMGVCL